MQIISFISGLIKLAQILIKKLKDFKINQQEKILDEMDTSSDSNIIDTAKRLHDNKRN